MVLNRGGGSVEYFCMVSNIVHKTKKCYVVCSVFTHHVVH